MSKHTPGPWTYDSTNAGFDADDWSIESDHGTTWKTLAARGEDCPIALITGHWNSPSGELRLEANASVIAAAPDMLAMLRNLVSEIRRYHGNFDARLFVQAERTIAKAEGKEPALAGDVPKPQGF